MHSLMLFIRYLAMVCETFPFLDYLVDKGQHQYCYELLNRPPVVKNNLLDNSNFQIHQRGLSDTSGSGGTFFDRYAKLDDWARGRFAAMSSIPVDIQPIYPDEV